MGVCAHSITICGRRVRAYFTPCNPTYMRRRCHRLAISTEHAERIPCARSGIPQVCLGTVDPSATATLSAIRDLQPYTISWSNVPDYIATAEFHKMARAVSADEDTVHFMHSMNWVKDVKGAFHVDMILSTAEKYLSQVSKVLLGQSYSDCSSALG